VIVRGRGEAVLLALLLLPGVAAAQDEQPPPALAPPPVQAPTPEGYGLPPPTSPPARAPEPEPAPVPAQSPSASDDIRYIDAHSDRYLFFPGGEVIPEGSVAISSYEVALLRLAYGITDDLMLETFILPPWDRIVSDGDDFPLFIDAGIKLNVVRTDGFRAAVFGSLEAFLDLERERNNAYALRVGGAGQICFEPTCHSSIALSTQIFFTGGDTDGATVAAMGVGIAGRVSEWVSFLAEPTTIVFLGDDSGDEGGISWLSFGLRISRANFGLDVVGLYIFTGEDDPLILPFLAFTYRTDPSQTATSAPLLAGYRPW
jgi:hypothetical protein